MPARTLYDLLRVRPDDDAETLQSAFREVVKAHHPDLNPGDADAPRRFRQIVTAYGILRNVEQRDAYDQLLARQRAQRRVKLTRTIAADAVAIVTLAVALVGSYKLFAHVRTPVETAKVVAAGHSPTRMMALEPIMPSEIANRDRPAGRWLPTPAIVAVPIAIAPKINNSSLPPITNRKMAENHVVEPVATAASHQAQPSGKSTGVEPADLPIAPSTVVPEADSSEPLVNERLSIGTPTSIPSESNHGVASAPDAADAGADRDRTRKAADDHPKNNASDSVDQNMGQSVEPQVSSPEKDVGGTRSASSDLAFESEKHSMRTIARSRAPAKRLAAGRVLVRQAELESRDTSQGTPESRNVRPPPLFGVGF